MDRGGQNQFFVSTTTTIIHFFISIIHMMIDKNQL